MRLWSDSKSSRHLFAGTLLGSAGVVVLVAAWLTIPRFWPVAKETSIQRALTGGGGPAFWWPATWREEYKTRESLEKVHRSVMNFFDQIVQQRHDRLQSTTDLHEAQAPGLEIGTAEDDKPKIRLAIIRQASDFRLTDQGDKPFQFANLNGRVRLVSFIFTTCNGSCPATTHRMSLVQQELKTRRLLEDGQVRLLSITLDPARDTPEVLERYMRLYDADSQYWSFLTGTVAEVHKTIAAWDMWVRPAPNGQLDHPSRIFLVDQRGRVREIYNLSFLKPAWVADDVKLLLDETEPTAGD